MLHASQVIIVIIALSFAKDVLIVVIEVELKRSDFNAVSYKLRTKAGFNSL